VELCLEIREVVELEAHDVKVDSEEPVVEMQVLN